MTNHQNNDAGRVSFYHEVIECLASALDAKDNYTSGHSSRVGDMCLDLALALGLSEEEADLIHFSGHLHDIGKIGVPDRVLLKEGRLDDEEWRWIKRHPVIGHDILSKTENLESVAKIVLYHHERWSGGGYPTGKKAEEFPLGSRIVSICDSVDAMVTKRSYKNSMSWEAALEEVHRFSGTQFDPYIVQFLPQVWDEWIKRHKEFDRIVV